MAIENTPAKHAECFLLLCKIPYFSLLFRYFAISVEAKKAFDKLEN